MTMTLAYLSEICRFFLVFILLASAWGKTANSGRFAQSLATDFQVPVALSMPLTWAILGLEWCAFGLLASAGPWARVGGGLALLLMIVFSAVMLEVILRRRHAYCHCFGRSTHPISALDLARNSLYIASCSFYLLNPVSTPSSGLQAQLSLVLVAFIGFFLSIRLHELKQLMN